MTKKILIKVLDFLTNNKIIISTINHNEQGSGLIEFVHTR